MMMKYHYRIFQKLHQNRVINVSIVIGDIVKLPHKHDAIVNCSNLSLSGSFQQKSYWMFAGRKNVDTSIQNVCGPKLLEACLNFPLIASHKRCNVGDAVVTPAFDFIGTKYIIHTVGPRYDMDQSFCFNVALKSSYLASFRQGDLIGAESIAFPAISCGIGNAPSHVAATACWDALAEYLMNSPQQQSKLKKITFCLFEKKTFSAWVKAAQHHDFLRPTTAEVIIND